MTRSPFGMSMQERIDHLLECLRRYEEMDTIGPADVVAAAKLVTYGWDEGMAAPIKPEDEQRAMALRQRCLELAIQANGGGRGAENVIPTAEAYWQFIVRQPDPSRVMYVAPVTPPDALPGNPEQ